MRVLILKISSLGDIIHTLPALTDAAKVIPGIRFDWAVEEAFAEIPTWHGSVERVIALAHRRWRKNPLLALRSGELVEFIQAVRAAEYDLIIDAQGQLIKTIWIGVCARGKRYGLDWSSAREPLAALFYNRPVRVPKGQHAVERVRQLFAQSLEYPVPEIPVDYGIDREKRFDVSIDARKLFFLHGTSWKTKEWPQAYWSELIRQAAEEGFFAYLTWGNAVERYRAMQLALGQKNVVVLRKMSLHGIAREIASAAGIVAVDTGLCHLAAALGVPTVSLYGPTATGLTGAYGNSQKYLSADFSCAPCFRKTCNYKGSRTVEPACFERLTAEKAWIRLSRMLENSEKIDHNPRSPYKEKSKDFLHLNKTL